MAASDQGFAANRRRPRPGLIALIVVGHLAALYGLSRALAPDFTAGVERQVVAAFTVTVTALEEPPPSEPAVDEGAQGDAGHGPNPSLAPLAKAPFYAVKIVPGSLGSFAGLKTDPAARVLDRAGDPIPGLFAVGNDMSSVMGGTYPSGGITLGPGMTFGYIAGRILAGQPVTGLSPEKEPIA